MRRLVVAWGLACVAVAGCSGDNVTQVDCTWFTGVNCYKALAAEAGTCIANPNGGMLAVDRASCSYTDGTTVTFATPVPTPAPTSYAWDLHVDKAGQTCMSFSDVIDINAGFRHFKLTTASGTFKFDAEGDHWDLSCPDGTVNRISMIDAFNCGLVGNPNKSTTSSATKVSLSLAGTATTLTPIFSCAP